MSLNTSSDYNFVLSQVLELAADAEPDEAAMHERTQDELLGMLGGMESMNAALRELHFIR
jgi:hypothetical protein